MLDLLTEAARLIDAGVDEQTAWTHVLADIQVASTPEVCEALAYVLTRAENDGDTVTGDFAAVVVEATFDVDGSDPALEDFVEPVRLRFIRYNLAQRLVEHPGLSFEAVQQVIIRTLRWVFVRSVKTGRGVDNMEVDLKHMLWMLSRTDVVDVATLGTVWRFFVNMPPSTRWFNQAMNWIRFNHNCPLPVVLHFYTHSEKAIPLKEENLIGRIADAYPELVDLPVGMVKEVVATQPVPVEWFTDTFPLPDGSVVRAPEHLVTV